MYRNCHDWAKWKNKRKKRQKSPSGYLGRKQWEGRGNGIAGARYLRASIRSKAILESRLMSSGTVISLLTLPSSSPSSIQST